MDKNNISKKISYVWVKYFVLMTDSYNFFFRHTVYKYYRILLISLFSFLFVFFLGSNFQEINLFKLVEIFTHY